MLQEFFRPVALLYLLCMGVLAGFTLVVLLSGSRRNAPASPLRVAFLGLAAALLVWIVTLFLEVRLASPRAQLWLGRLNFAAVAAAAPLGLWFVREAAGLKTDRWSVMRVALLLETGILTAVTLFTPLVSAAERVETGRAVTTFGPLFPVYLFHVVGYLTWALGTAFRAWRRAADRRVRGQMAFIGLGMLATGSLAFVTNALLPYGFGLFGLCDVGTLSTLFFLLAVAYATFIHRLFDLRVVVRETLVYGVLLTFVLGAYSSAVFLLSQHLTSGAEQGTQFVVLLIAFSFDPLRRFLEEKTDRLLFGERGEEGKRGAGRGVRKGRTGSRTVLALLFPWSRRGS